MIDQILYQERELDTLDHWPLHTVVAKGHLDTLGKLQHMDVETGLNRLTVMHVAAIKGQTLVLRELVRVRPELVWVPTEQGETALHLTVKWNHLEAVKVLVEEINIMKNTSELVNWKDCDGNTVLHVAVSNKHLHIISYLLTLNGLQVNALNKNEMTPMDLLTSYPRDLKAMEIERALKNGGASSVNDLHIITHDWFLGKAGSIMKTPSSPDKHIDWIYIILLVVVSLTGTVAFHAGVSLASIWPDKCILDVSALSTTDLCKRGEKDTSYDTVAGMVVETTFLGLIHGPIFYGVWKLPVKRRWWIGPQILIMWVAVSFQVGLYLVALQHMDRQCPIQ